MYMQFPCHPNLYQKAMPYTNFYTNRQQNLGYITRFFFLKIAFKQTKNQSGLEIEKSTDLQRCVTTLYFYPACTFLKPV